MPTKTTRTSKRTRLVHRHSLIDSQWEQLKKHIVYPKKGRPHVDDRRNINGILWILKTGAPWRDLPDEFGFWNTVYQRFRVLVDNGTLARIFKALVQMKYDLGEIDLEFVAVDSTIIRAHKAAAGAPSKKGEPENHAIGKSCGGRTTKITVAGERNLNGLSVMVSAGQESEVNHLIPAMQAIFIVDTSNKRAKISYASGDKAFSSKRNREYLAGRDIIAVIPHRKNEKDAELPFEQAERYKERNCIERLFGRIKECRRVATRYEKYAFTYCGMVLLSLIRLML